MLQPKQEERATAKELKDLIKKCNIINDTKEENKNDSFWIEEKVNFFKTRKYKVIKIILKQFN